MKKISTLFLGLIIALSAVAAPQFNEKDLDLLKANNSFFAKAPFKSLEQAPVKHVLRAPQQAKDAEAFTVELSEITTQSVLVTVTAADQAATYYLSTYEAAEIADKSDDEIAAGAKGEMDNLIMLYNYFGVELSYGDLLSAGSKSSPVKDLTQNTDYTVVLVPMDANANLTGAVVRANFHTEALVIPAGGDFEMIAASEKYYTSGDVWVQMMDADSNVYRFDIKLAEGIKALESGVEYTMAVMDTGYTYASYQGVKIEYASATLTKTIAENGDYQIAASFVDTLNHTWNLNYSYVKPVKNREVELSLTDLELHVYEGAWQLAGFYENETSYITIAAKAATIAGDYATANLMADYTYIYTDLEFDAEGNLVSGNKYELVDADLHVAYNAADSTIVITGTMLCVNGEDVPEFTLNLIGKEVIDGKTYDAEDSDFNHNFATYTINDENLAEYHSLYIEAIDGESYYLILDVTLAEQDNSLVPGVYPVASEYDPQSVFGGYYDEENGFIPSFAASLVNQEGKLYYNEMWFFTEGAVTVNADGSIDVEAVNSYGRIIRSHLGKAEGVENTDAAVKAAKVLRNGQLFIIKNGVEYNALGTIVK